MRMSRRSEAACHAVIALGKARQEAGEEMQWGKRGREAREC